MEIQGSFIKLEITIEEIKNLNRNFRKFYVDKDGEIVLWP